MLASGGKARAFIAVPAPAPENTALAARELAHYLERVTGAEFEIVPEDQVAPGALVLAAGMGRLARAAGVDPARVKPEGYEIRRSGNTIVLAGADRDGPYGERGSMHAVSDFLEREIGVRWLWPGELGTVVPARPTLAVEVAPRLRAPAFRLREIQDGLAKPGNLARMRYGMKLLGMTEEARASMAPASEAWVLHARIGASAQAHCGENFHEWWNEFGESHPEYFAQMPDGSRQWPFDPGIVKMCVSNPGVAEEWMKKARSFFAEHPHALSYSASANDSVFTGACTCAACEALDEPGAQVYQMTWKSNGEMVKRPHVSLTDRYNWFYNRAAAMLAKEFPDKLLCGHAYGTWRNPPLREKLADNVMISYVGFYDRYYSDDSRARARRDWTEWSARASKLHIRPNVLHSGYGMMGIYIHKLAEDIRYLRTLGVQGFYWDKLLHRWASQGLNYYALARLLWDPDADMDALLRDYCECGFGPAARAMEAYYRDVEARTDWIAKRYVADETDRTLFVRMSPEFFPADVVTGWKARLRAAARLVPAGSDWQRRILWHEFGLEFTELTTAVVELTRKPSLTPEEREQLKRRYAARETWYRAHLTDWAMFGPQAYYREGAIFGHKRASGDREGI